MGVVQYHGSDDEVAYRGPVLLGVTGQRSAAVVGHQVAEGAGDVERATALAAVELEVCAVQVSYDPFGSSDRASSNPNSASPASTYALPAMRARPCQWYSVNQGWSPYHW